MKTEIEVKFVDVDIDDIRKKLIALGATCEQPMRLMRRVVIETDFMREGKDSYLRIRDEGDRVTMTYKQFDSLSLHGAKEIEVEVNDFDNTIAILAQAGLPAHTYQETRRETWSIDDAEIVIDEWPWLPPYIEIEAPSEEKVREAARELGFKWESAVFGDVMAAYRMHYPHLTEKDTVGTIERVTFNEPVPKLFIVKDHSE